MSPVDPSGPAGADYSRTVTVQAQPGSVYAAIASIEGLRAWWTPSVTRLGRDLRFAFEGIDESIVMRVDEATSPTTVRWTCTEHTGHPEWVGTRLAFAIEGVSPDRTVLYFLHTGLAPTLDCYAQCERGWDHFLRSIATFAESGRGTPYGS